MKDGLIISLLSIIPKKPTARFMGYSARIRFPQWINRAILKAFVWKYKINMEESTAAIEEFHSLSDLFLRKLKDGVRSIDPSPTVWTSPVDGKIHSFGYMDDGLFLQNGALFGSVSSLLGEDEFFAPQQFKHGSYMIIYLSPQDYHRVHSHKEGRIKKIRYLPGRLWPVFPAATRKIKSLFDKNERLVFQLETKEGEEILAMIGAFGVGRMGSPFIDIESSQGHPQQDFTQEIEIERGSEVGQFALGSTVILLWPHQRLDWCVQENQPIQLGCVIARETSSVEK